MKSRHSKSSALARPRTEAERDGVDAAPPGQSGVRLQRVLAAAGVAARRICEEMIEAGRVEINGKIQKRLPIFVDPSEDRITVDGKPIPRAKTRAGGGARSGAKPGRVRPTDLGGRMLYIMLHKPPRVMSTTAEDERTTILDLVDHPGIQSKKNPAGQRVFPVGRLDFHTAGLVLLTSDGECANRLTHPRYGVPKLYEALVKGTFDDKFAHDLTKGLSRKHVRAAMEMGENPDDPDADRINVRILERREGKTLLEITLCETSKRPLAEMLNEAGVPVTRLIRTGIGPLRLRGVGPGQWRELDRDEIRVLRSGDNRPLRGTETTRGVTPASGRNRENMRPAAAEAPEEGGEFDGAFSGGQPERVERFERPQQRTQQGAGEGRPFTSGRAPARGEGYAGGARDRNERGGNAGRGERPGYAGQSARPDRAERPSRFGRGERNDRAARSEPPERGYRNDRPSRDGRFEQSARPEGQGAGPAGGRVSKQQMMNAPNGERFSGASDRAGPRGSDRAPARGPASKARTTTPPPPPPPPAAKVAPVMKKNPRTGRAGPRVLRPGSGS